MSNVIDFNKPYNRNEFISFLQKFLPDSFKVLNEETDLTFKPQFIIKVNRIGIVDELDLPVYEIFHDSENDPRVGLSRDSFRLIANYGYSSALCTFILKTPDNYRFSLININPEIKEGKVIKKYSNPRRFSYFLGQDAKIHTPTDYLVSKGKINNLEDLTARFSVEIVNKEFYNKIAFLFTKLAGGKRKIGSKEIDEKQGELFLPTDNTHKRKQEFAVRLIGRIMFCWFLKKKDLISDEILSTRIVAEYSNYYHELLEKLFFLVLNKKIEERNSEVRTSIYDNVPFLNGGLFEPHIDDGFYVNHKTGGYKFNGALKVPNEWFITFFELLETYNFTVDENTPVDIDLSIEPEMLGRIFENLLAEINPDTGETARKQSGSYYTPRIIVEYMVNESLKQYLLNNSDLSENKINEILDYDLPDVDLSDKEQEEIVHLLHSCKIIDPACGSGAFPMGVLQKILLILEKVDTDSKLWLNKKFEGISDSILREEIKRNLTQKNFEYVHKLGIIHNCIYGVDIQPIAVEISKLRVFLSLIVDEKLDKSKRNLGVEPLPNLEFKFVCANSLIGLEEDKEQIGDLSNTDELIDKLILLRENYFTSIENDKEKIKMEFIRIQDELSKRTSIFNISSKAAKLSDWHPFSDESSDWFDPFWMFGIKDGFDIVIANPPYGADINKSDLSNLIKNYKHYDRQKNTASFFLEFANNIVKQNGIVAYIIPKSLSFSSGWAPTRELISKKNKIQSIIDVSKAFEEVLLEQIIVIFTKKMLDSYSFYSGTGWNNLIKIINKTSNSLIYKLDIFPIYINNIKKQTLDKFKDNSILLGNISDTFRGLPLQQYISNEGELVLKGKNIGKYKTYNTIDKVKIPKKIQNSKKIKRILKEKIISQNIVAHVNNPYDRIIIMATLNDNSYLNMDTVMNTIITDHNYNIKYILAILNSKLASWFYYWFVYNRAIRTMHFDKYYLNKLPIKKADSVYQQKFINLVEEIIYNNEKNKDNSSAEIENKIDIMVYKLYDLTYDEILEIDPNFKLSSIEYDNFKL